MPGEKAGTFLAGSFNSAPVRGLRPIQAARLLFLKVPKPIIDTASPFAKILVMLDVTIFTTFVASEIVNPDFEATSAINSDLFIKNTFFVIDIE